MSNPSIKSHQTNLKMFRNGELVNITTITGFEVNQDSTFTRSRYVGQQLPEGDQSMDGFSGSADMETKNAEADRFIDALVNNNLNGIGIDDCTLIDTENYSDGSTRSYVYFDVQWKLSKRASANEKVTKRLEWQASGRIPL